MHAKAEERGGAGMNAHAHCFKLQKNAQIYFTKNKNIIDASMCAYCSVSHSEKKSDSERFELQGEST